jgi:molybdenum cofactor biosynthesis enzyme MoaA
MVRLPARLTAKLAKFRIAQIFNSAKAPSRIHCMDPAEVLHPGSQAPVSREKMQELIENPAPVIWIGGSEPLLHAGIGHFVRAIVQSGHFIFLETDGTLLRRRIHEFQPLPELFLTFRLDSLQSAGSALAVEGLRAARLSGFFTVVHSIVHEHSDLAKLSGIQSFIKEKDMDGWLITGVSAEEPVARKAAEARGMIRRTFWRQFSEYFEQARLSQTRSRKVPHLSGSVAENLQVGTHEEARQERVGIA